MIVGMHPYLVTNGNGQEAVKFYEAALDAQVVAVQTFGDLPENPEHPTPPGAENLVLNAHLKVGNMDLMLSDNFPGLPYQLGSQVTIALILNDAKKTEEVFAKLQDGGKVDMALQETFWSPLYGQVTDKFGVQWQLSTLGSDNQ
ncbi:VOC family protein [Paenibacillus sp. YPG26]|uniref:VOC family protein n=1 Tax=Paenibacillus sp. YPG26 TaxID=2878915 RepID=UPI002041DC41|nr:VOC family protein [Paenibacillus sp. YPG26]USB31693.1 VOC family protein [Paenibacillus sp. YPG26]